MMSVGTYEAKTRLSELIAKVNDSGEQIAITSHGNVVALLSPPTPKPPQKIGNFEEAVEHWLITRKNVRLNGLCVRDLINAGRR
jgi:prevent-host-death family protein